MRAVKDDYKPRSMETLCQEALEILRASPVSMRCTYIGEQLFHDASHFRGSAPFARIAGKIMKRLAEAGLAEDHCFIVGGRYYSGWRATHKGRLCNYMERKSDG